MAANGLVCLGSAGLTAGTAGTAAFLSGMVAVGSCMAMLEDLANLMIENDPWANFFVNGVDFQIDLVI